MNETPDNKNLSDLHNAGDMFDKVHDILSKAGYTVNQVTPQVLEQCRRKETNPKKLPKSNSGDKDDQAIPRLTVFSNSKTGLSTEEECRHILRQPVLKEAMRLGLLMTDDQFLIKELDMALRSEMLDIPIKMQIENIVERISEEEYQRRLE